MTHVRLSKLVSEKDKGVSSYAVKAADSIADAGGSPRAQIDAARNAAGARLSYNAHVGAKQAERGRAKLAKKFLPCPLCGQIEACKHSRDERQKAWFVTEEVLLDNLREAPGEA